MSTNTDRIIQSLNQVILGKEEEIRLGAVDLL